MAGVKGVKVEGFKISGYPDWGILVEDAKRNRIIGNEISNCLVGIKLIDADNNYLKSNIVNNNTIHLECKSIPAEST